MRIGLSKKLRFDVFKRDYFTCQYCGNKPPKIILEVDHIIPVIKNGTNQVENLITACFDCNRGKGKHELQTVPETTIDKNLKIAEAELQYKEFKKLQKRIENRLVEEINELECVFSRYFSTHEMTDKFKLSVKNFINKLGYTETKEALELACSKINDPNACLKYFCGICWNKIKTNEQV